MYICAVQLESVLLVYPKKSQKKAVEFDICCHNIAANTHLKNGFILMRPCYPQICIWTDPIYKNKLTQIAIFS